MGCLVLLLAEPLILPVTAALVERAAVRGGQDERSAVTVVEHRRGRAQLTTTLATFPIVEADTYGVGWCGSITKPNIRLVGR